MKKVKLFLMSHGQIAVEALVSATLIAGDIDNATAISVLPHEGREEIMAKLETVLDELQEDGSNVIILADLYGGTPANIAVLCCADRENVEIVTGMNLPMIIAYALSPLETMSEIIEEMKLAGVEGIRSIDINSSDDDDDEIEL